LTSIYYTDEPNVLMLISMLKQAGIKRVIASPGTTNSALVISLQHDPYFELFSAVDERSAAYMSCGMAIETNEPVMITCTGATASRNYLPGLTEAFYKKLPILAVTGSQDVSKVGHLTAQHIDRSQQPKDTYLYSDTLPYVHDPDTKWDCMIKLNRAKHTLLRSSGGPVHLNLPVKYNQKYSTKKLPKLHSIDFYSAASEIPNFDGKTVNIFAGSGRLLNKDQTAIIDQFCEQNDSYVIRDHASCYQGKYSIQTSLIASQKELQLGSLRSNITIHIGEVTGDYPSSRLISNNVWRVSSDGEIKDPFRRLSKIFNMDIESFCTHFINKGSNVKNINRFNSFKKITTELRNEIGDLPLSNIWIAKELHKNIPSFSNMHFGILNSLRSWNLFELDESIDTSSNVGGFGIDGCLSTLIGSSLVAPKKLHFIVIGDLAVFYDLNVLGNRHLGKNVRILLVNNGCGTEFKNFGHHTSVLGQKADAHVAASGHFGNKSTLLMKGFAESMNIRYLSAKSKDQFKENVGEFLSPNDDKSILFEVFTESESESKALELVSNLRSNNVGRTKEILKKTLGKTAIRKISSTIRKL
jgi:2-succinyl-5-enolpyruvyl-6-hydroxy-3-cyclohexene-1-carboxylate synthase